MLLAGGLRPSGGQVADQRRRLEIFDQTEQVGLVRKPDYLQVLIGEGLANVAVPRVEQVVGRL